MRDVSHPDAVSSDAALCANGIARTPLASRLVKVRHVPCRIPTEAYHSRRTEAWLRLYLPAIVPSRVHMEEAFRRLARGCAGSRDVVSIQTVQPLLALADQETPGSCRVESSGGVDAATAPIISKTISGERHDQ